MRRRGSWYELLDPAASARQRRTRQQRLDAARALFWAIADDVRPASRAGWHLVSNSFQLLQQQTISSTYRARLQVCAPDGELDDAPAMTFAEVAVLPLTASRAPMRPGIKRALLDRGYGRSRGWIPIFGKMLDPGARAVREEKLCLEQLLGGEPDPVATVPFGFTAAHARDLFRRSPAWRPSAAEYMLRWDLPISGGRLDLVLELSPRWRRQRPLAPGFRFLMSLPEMHDEHILRLRRFGYHAAIARHLGSAGYRGLWEPLVPRSGFFRASPMKTAAEVLAERRRIEPLSLSLVDLLEREWVSARSRIQVRGADRRRGKRSRFPRLRLVQGGAGRLA